MPRLRAITWVSYADLLVAGILYCFDSDLHEGGQIRRVWIVHRGFTVSGNARAGNTALPRLCLSQ